MDLGWRMDRAIWIIEGLEAIHRIGKTLLISPTGATQSKSDKHCPPNGEAVHRNPAHAGIKA